MSTSSLNPSASYLVFSSPPFSLGISSSNSSSSYFSIIIQALFFIFLSHQIQKRKQNVSPFLSKFYENQALAVELNRSLTQRNRSLTQRLRSLTQRRCNSRNILTNNATRFGAVDPVCCILFPGKS